MFFIDIRAWKLKIKINDRDYIWRVYKPLLVLTWFLLFVCTYYVIDTANDLIHNYIHNLPMWGSCTSIPFPVFFLCVEFGYGVLCAFLLATKVFSTIGWICNILAFIALVVYHPYDIAGAVIHQGYPLALWFSILDFLFALHQLILITIGGFCYGKSKRKR